MISMSAKDLFTFFQENAICESLTKQDVETLTHYLIEKDYAGGDMILDRGDVGDFLAIIVSGNVEFISFKGQGPAPVGRQGEGSLIGEMSFFDRKPRDLRMEASKKGVKLLELTRPMYDRIKVEEPYIVVNILENAIVSLDILVRNMSNDISALGSYMKGFGKQ